MAITYVIYENPIAPGQYRALTRALRTVELEDVIDRLLTRGSTVTRADTLAVLTGFFELVPDMLLEGYRVRTPLVTFSASVQGNFEGVDDRFWPGRHAVKAVVRPGPALTRAMRRARPLKGELKPTGPLVSTCEDAASGTSDTLLTPRGMARLRGQRLRFNPADGEEGVFLVSADGAGETPATQFAQNKPAELVFLVPALAPGRYYVEVRARHRSRWLSRGRLPQAVVVLEPGNEPPADAGPAVLSVADDEALEDS